MGSPNAKPEGAAPKPGVQGVPSVAQINALHLSYPQVLQAQTLLSRLNRNIQRTRLRQDHP